MFNYSSSVTPSVRGMGGEMTVLAVMVTSPGHSGCQVVMDPGGEMTLVWPAGDRGDHGWSHHHYFINTRDTGQIRRVCGAINGGSFICGLTTVSTRPPRPGPFITRVINCGEIIAEPARGDQGAEYTGGPHSLQLRSRGGQPCRLCQWPAQASPGVIKCSGRGHT